MFNNKSDFENRYFDDWAKLSDFLDSYRKCHYGVKIGFVGGVWDMKHEAHEAYLEKAKELVDRLVVGVDTDEFTRSRKSRPGLDRPRVPLVSRARSIAHVRHVDLITFVNEDFVSLLTAVKPDVLVFSETTADLAEQKRKEYEKYAGEIVLLEPQAPPEMISTSAQIKSIANDALKMAEQAALKGVADAVGNAFREIREGL